MVLWAVLIVLAVVLFVVYLKGVKAGAGWGTPVAAVLALVLVGGALATIMTGGSRGRDRRTISGRAAAMRMIQARDRDLARAIATGLKDRLGASPRLFVMGMGTERRRSFNEGLKEGFGGETWQVVGSYGGPVWDASAEDVNAALAGVQGEIDGVISFDGLPEDARALSIYARPSPPPVGVYFRGGVSPEQVYTLLADGLVQVAVMVKEGQVKVFTPQAPP